MRQAGPPPPIPLTLLTGPAGAGKTALLNALVESPRLTGALVLQNEPGATALDARFLTGPTEEASALAAGCLCCTALGDFVALMETLLRHRDNGRIPDFPRLVLETAGTADPAPMLATIQSHPYLARRYRIAGVVALLQGDVPEDEDTIRQVTLADVLVLAPGAQGGDVLRDWLLRQNPEASLLRFDQALSAPDRIFGDALHQPSRRIAKARGGVLRHRLGRAGR